MAAIQHVGTGVIFRNPKPHLRSVHAYFPWVTALPSGELLASFQVGSAFEAADAHCELARSTDNGETWRLTGPLYPGTGPERPTSDCFKVTADPSGAVIAFGSRFDRSDPEASICNDETGGILPMEVLVSLSADGGRTWPEPTRINAPIEGSFEAQAPVEVLADGRWIVPVSTWRNWDGSHPNGDKTLALISDDKGHSWPHVTALFEDPRQRLIFWEVRIIQMQPGELLAVGWAHDQIEGKDIQNQFSLSHDGGGTWSEFCSLGFNGQSCCPAYLGDGRVLFTYNYRYDEPGVRARLARLEADQWLVEDELVLWGVGAEGRGEARQDDKRMVHEMSSFKFGQPSPHLLPDGTIFTTHWCVDDCVGEIRWNRLVVD